MIEQGTNPSLRSLMKVCDALGTDIASVLDEEGIGTLPGKKKARTIGV
jgi:hypothetical protein